MPVLPGFVQEDWAKPVQQKGAIFGAGLLL